MKLDCEEIEQMSFFDFMKGKLSRMDARSKMIKDFSAYHALESGTPLERLFRRSMADLRILFNATASSSTRPIIPSSSYPAIKWQGEFDINAFLHWQHIEIDQYPLYLKAVRDLMRESDMEKMQFSEGENHALVKYSDELAGRNVYILSNDARLIERLALPRFSPPPPWIFHFEHGPFLSYNQGAPEYWFDHVWLPFWLSLSLEDQSRYLEQQRQRTMSYITNEEWSDWVYAVRSKDPRTREEAERE
jgi:hypothetical protein